MKKIISVILLLAMCIACFAGCAPKEDAALEAAKDYLFALYKDAKKETSTNYTVVSQVRIDNVAYPITWSTDVSEDLVKITAGENNMTVVEVHATAEDVNYKLIATMENADGLTVSVSFDHVIPAAAQVPTDNVVLFYPAENKYVTGTHHLYEAKNKYELVLSEDKAEAVVLTVQSNDDNTVSFVAGDQYLFCDASDVKFVAEQSDNTKFVLEETNDGYFIKCAIANYNDSAQYLEVYSGYLTCYGMNDSKAEIYTFKLESAEGASGVISGGSDEEPVTPPVTEPPATEPPATNPPATNPPATQAPAVTTGASVTFDFSSLDKNGVEITADEALALFNGVASGSGLTGVTVTKIYNGNSTGGAFENTAGFIRCGKSDADGELVMTFSKKVAKVEVLCHDWYAKSDGYPTNSNYIAINGGTAQLAPYTTDGTCSTLTFNLDGSSNTVDFDFTNTQSGRTGRVFIFKIIVTFAE